MPANPSAAAALSALDRHALDRRLRELTGDERNVQVDFLLHLDEFDRRHAFLEAGYDSLWTYCLRVLHLREGPAGRRIGAMRVLRRFPAIEPALRDGRLCLSNTTLLGRLLTPDNVDELVGLAAYKTKAEVEHLVASLRPGSPPRDGVRAVAAQRKPAAGAALDGVLPFAGPGSMTPSAIPAASSPSTTGPAAGSAVAPAESTTAVPAPSIALLGIATTRVAISAVESAPVPEPSPDRPSPVPAAAWTGRQPRRSIELRPVSPQEPQEWSLRVTLDGSFKADLERLSNLLAHKARGDLTAVLREAVRCGIEKHGKRKGAVHPTRTRPPPRAGSADEAPMTAAARLSRASDPTQPPRETSAPHQRPGAPACAGTPIPGLAPACARTSIPAEALLPPMISLQAGLALTAPATPRGARAIPAAIRRAVWERDGGTCTWTAEDGRRCGSQWMLELDHAEPVALGGASTVDNLRLRCRGHNLLEAERVFGREYMARVRPRRRVAGVGTGAGVLIPG